MQIYVQEETYQIMAVAAVDLEAAKAKMADRFGSFFNPEGEIKEFSLDAFELFFA